MSKVTAYELARQIYERTDVQVLESRVPWAKVPNQNKRRLVEAAGEILRWLEGESDE